jgi:AraC family transcriptional regulator
MNQSDATELCSVVLKSLDDPAGPGELARRVFRSRTQFFRLFQALIEESPGALRRRVLLERAAWQLAGTNQPVTEIAFDAGYGSLEAFTRAFRKAFHISPSLYRRTGLCRIHLPAPNYFHFRPPQNTSKGIRTNMDLFDLFAGTDSWHTRRLLRGAAALSDEQLDRPVSGAAKVFPWDKPDRNLREMLERIVQTKEVWTAALTGSEMPSLNDTPAALRTPAALLERFDKADAEFDKILRGIRDRGAWDETFVDALCEPPETFTYGGMFADVIMFNSYRRLTALDALDKLGIKIPGYGSPMEYQQEASGQPA